ncbi:nucleotide sugar dehydrogenase [Actinokineospora sp. NBRC 105648]|uniref:nucleotide sugar dehydrogenase n=1 Tax=Actinokineospora sp. NBRC 105648 TaxID=3032206 RepID=UPI0024A5546A|nr:nucleotide sugar dehydrogenase [Actinokineospora sp. NBRC 105648]GLZ36431.1 UDP-N-acetyl-D-glucosamine dehydrogenase [Actinokineospora sp. NBRC 105648]
MSVDLVVVGLGYVGLPLARRACAAGLAVVGVDTDPDVVSGLRSGRSHVQDAADAEIHAMLDNGFRTTTTFSPVSLADTVVICVPTGLVDGEPDLRAVMAAGHSVAAHLRPGTLVVLESTSYPGTTEEVLLPILESTGLVAGVDFNLAYSPERIDPGNGEYVLENTPKVVSGLTPVCAKRCEAFYEELVDSVVVAAGLREAETAKLLENSYRLVNIALVNELAVFCDRLGIDVWDVLRCSATKPFGFQPFSPGPGVGGHCIPVDPRYLANRARAEGLPCSMVTTAQEVNAGMPGYVVRRARDILARDGGRVYGARVLLLGVTYKADVGDLRQSPAVGVVRQLRAMGVEVLYCDPHAPAFSVDDAPVRSVSDVDHPVDLVVLLQAHRCYDLGALGQRVVLDARGKVEGDRVERL